MIYKVAQAEVSIIKALVGDLRSKVRDYLASILPGLAN
jgi:hypothetical protein